MKTGGVQLNLVLTYHWYDEYEAGNKRIEYRVMSENWRRKIWERRDEISSVRFQRGYTKTASVYAVQDIDVGPCPYDGWDDEYYRIYVSEGE